jgi:hypothetical protein
MQDLIVFGGIALLALIGVSLFNRLMNTLAARHGIAPSDEATAHLDHDDDYSVGGKPKMGGVVDEDGYF